MQSQDLNETNLKLEIELRLSQQKGPPSDAWKKGPKITKELLKSAKPGKPDYDCPSHLVFYGMIYYEIELGSEGDTKVNPVLGFGKYKGKTYQWIYDNDKNYHYWACENVPNYEHRANASITKR